VSIYAASVTTGPVDVVLGVAGVADVVVVRRVEDFEDVLMVVEGFTDVFTVVVVAFADDLVVTKAFTVVTALGGTWVKSDCKGTACVHGRMRSKE